MDNVYVLSQHSLAAAAAVQGEEVTKSLATGELARMVHIRMRTTNCPGALHPSVRWMVVLAE